MSEIRIFLPREVKDLRPECLPFIGQPVTVESWHDNVAMLDKYPAAMKVGFVQEFYLDLPESELIEKSDVITCPRCEGRKQSMAMVCGPGVSGMRRMDCHFCHGAGLATTYAGIQFRMGRRLKEARQEADLSQREAAKAYGISFLEWNDLEQGRAMISKIDDATYWVQKRASTSTANAR